LEIGAGVVNGGAGAGSIFTFSSLAFVSDLAEPRPSPYWWVLLYSVATGLVAVGYMLVSTRFIQRCRWR